MNVLDILNALSRPQLGSFGEAVFSSVATNCGFKVQDFHNQRTDFLVDEIRTDVKTSVARLNTQLPALHRWKGHRIPSVQYAKVEFHTEGVRISIEDMVIGGLDWPEVEVLFTRWQAGEFGRAHQPAVGASRRLPQYIQDDVNQLFLGEGLKSPAIIFRTCQGTTPSGAPGFKEGPHNLLASQRPPRYRKGWTVFLIFAESPPTWHNLLKIIAFADARGEEFPRLKRASLGKKPTDKVDIVRLPADTQFRSLESLKIALNKH